MHGVVRSWRTVARSGDRAGSQGAGLGRLGSDRSRQDADGRAARSRSVGKYEYPGHTDSRHRPDAGQRIRPSRPKIRTTDRAAGSGGSCRAGREPSPKSSCGAGCCGHAEPVDRCSFGFDDDGRFRLNLECDQLTGMIIEKSMEEARDALFQGGQIRCQLGRRRSRNGEPVTRCRRESVSTEQVPGQPEPECRRPSHRRGWILVARRDPPVHRLRRSDHPGAPRRWCPRVSGAYSAHRARPHPTCRGTSRRRVRGAGVYRPALLGGASHHPLGRWRRDRHLELDLLVSAPSPFASPGEARHHRQR